MSAKFSGNVMTGFGEGAYFIGKYAGLIQEKLGFAPFFGTLNLKLNEDSDPQRVEEAKSEAMRITLLPGGTFKPVHCYHAMIKVNGKNVKGALVAPEATRHPSNVVELIARENMREVFGLKDGDKVELELE